MTPLLLGVDAGTTALKALCIGADGEIVGTASRTYPSFHNAPDRSEQNPEDWWRAMVEAVREATRGRGREVCGLCLSTQGGTLVPADASGIPMGRAIVWNDARCAEEREIIRDALGEHYFFHTTGWPMAMSYNALQILHMRRNEPERFRRAARFLSVPDFFSLRLTGRAAIDPSNGGTNHLLNVNRLRWDEKILDALGIEASTLADVVHSGEVVGGLTREAAEALGLREGIPLAAGAHDQYCAALGAGAAKAGDVLLATGTAWVTLAIADTPDYDETRLIPQSRSAINGKWGGMAALEAGGACLDWFCQHIAQAGASSYEDVTVLAAQSPIGASGVRFYPYLNGCPYPAFRPEARGAFEGLSLGASRADMARAVMEGVAFQAVWALEAFPRGEALTMVGGATKSPLWVQMVADAANLPALLPTREPASLGAAILAGVGAGVFANAQEGVEALRGDVRRVEPEHPAAYAEAFSLYKNEWNIQGRTRV